MRCLLVLLAIVLTLPSPLDAQGGKVPSRPRLGADADTNDARAYFAVGERLIDIDPRTAANAFYWAARIDPGWADAWYGRRVAMLMADPRLAAYMRSDRRVQQSEHFRAIDSLYLRALALDPLLYRQFDRRMLVYYIRQASVQSIRASGGQVPSEGELQFWIEQFLNQGDPAMRAWMAYGDRAFGDALRYYDLALRRSRDRAWLRAERGRIFLMVGEPDSALTQLTLALQELRARDDKELVVLYNSKAVLEHTVGQVHERRGELAAAREAYGRALQEDLSYYPAHVAIANLSITAGDSAAGISALEMAVQLRGDEPRLRATYGYLLAVGNKLEEAAAQLQKAVELEPYYAVPYRWLGDVADQQMKPDEAVAHYRRFLALASRNHPMRAEVQDKVLQHTASNGGAP